MAKKGSRFWAWLFVGCALPVLAHAQNAAPGAQPKVNSLVDTQGVDLLSGQLVMNVDLMAIGDPKQGGITFGVSSTPLESDSLDGDVSCSTTPATSTSVAFYSCAVELGTYTRTFKQDYGAGTFTSQQGDGVTFTFDGTIYTLTLRDGTVAHFSTADTNLNSTARIADIHAPDGTVTTHYYKHTTQSGVATAVKTGVGNNLGLGIKYIYSNGTIQVIGVNESVEYCDLTADTCSVSASWPRVQYSSGSWTDARGQVFSPATFSAIDPNSTPPLKEPGRPNWTVTYDDSARVLSMNNGKGTWKYSYGTTYGPVDGSGASGSSDNNPTTYVTDPNGVTRIVVTSATFGTVLSDTNGVSQTTRYTYDGWGRLLSVTTPEGVRTSYIPDPRGNILETDVTSKDGSQTLRSYAHYPSDCPNPATCNKPTATFDFLGNETDYTYTAQGLTSQILGPPSSGAGGLRSEEDFFYTAKTAQYYQDSSGVLRAAPSQVVRLTGTSACSSAQTCGASTALYQTALAYGTNNLALTSSTAGNGGTTPLWATTTYAYDSFGNITTVTDPRNKTTRYRWAFDHQLIGITQPNPERAEAHPDPAIKFGYASDQYHVTTVNRGTVTDQSDGGWANFSTLAQQVTSYDSVDNKSSIKLVTGGVTQTLTQFAYDSGGRLQCTAVRMNTAAFSSAPGACDLGAQGPFGQDRITYLQYDADNRLTSSTTGYKTSTQKIEATTTTFTNDGLPQTQKDGNGNLTTYAYDGFNRLSSIEYPMASNGSMGNPADYAQFSYDANGRIVSTRRRDGKSVAYTYDGAGRLTLRSGPEISSVTLTYDNLGRTLTAYSGGQNLTYTYDSFGRTLTETGPLGMIAWQYDLGGNRTQIQWPGSFIANYVYDANGLLTDVKDPSETLAHYKYDDLGRRAESGHAGTGTTYTSVEDYSYGSDLNLSSIALTTGDGSRNETLAFWYNAAGQVRASTSSNALYDWAGSGNISRPYTADGLNRYALSGSVALGYDGLGDVTNDTRMTYTYDGLSKLISLGNGASLSYDAGDRLRAITTSSATTRFLYEGSQIIGEYSGTGAVLWRYVPGAAGDEAAAWYRGSGYGSREYPLTDRQGSVIALTNDAGGVVGINTYDDAGTPASTNAGRFQYDGAPWISETGLYHMRARDYSTTLGRFMQPDPTGYADGMNFYDYVHSDPVNGSDPQGTGPCTLDEPGTGACNGGGAYQVSALPTVSEVVVTAVSARALLERYFTDAGRELAAQLPSGHDYGLTDKVCNRALSSGDQADVMARYARPGATEGHDFRGSEAIVGVGPIPGGIVTTLITNSGHSATNITTAFHVFVGTVDRRIYAQGGATYIDSHGYGNAGPDLLGEFRDALNGATGPVIMKMLDNDAARYAKAHYSGC